MNLEFGILWIEDSYSDAEEESLKQAAAAAGFEAKITTSKDGANLEALGEQQRLYHPFDLVLLDLNLADGAKGDELASEARARFRSTPILFYSGSVADDAELRRMMAAQNVEGVFCSHRRNFVNRAGEVIADLALSLNRLSGMRGLAMGVVAETDILCRDVVLALANRGLAEKIIGELDCTVVGAANKLKVDFPQLEGLEARLKHRAVDSMKLFNSFRDLLKVAIREVPAGDDKDQLSAMRGETKGFRDQVLNVRNVLGHAKEAKTKEGWVILDENGDVFLTVQDFPTHRRRFLAQLKAIREIHRILVVEKAQ